MTEASILGVGALLLGLCLGSFLNVCIVRMPQDRSVVRPPSHCPGCRSGIAWYDNLPVLSWLMLRGRCRRCEAPISRVYPLVELLTGILVWLVWRNVVGDDAVISLGHAATFVYYTVFVCMLIGLTFIDVRFHIIPDEFSIYAVPIGVLGAWGVQHAGGSAHITWQYSVIGALVGGGFLATIAGVFWLIRRQEGMGMGDIKLLAMIGSFLGAFPALLVVLILSSVIGSVVGLVMIATQGRTLRLALPYGPFLALGALAYLLYGEQLVHWIFLPIARLGAA